MSSPPFRSTLLIVLGRLDVSLLDVLPLALFILLATAIQIVQLHIHRG